MFSPIIFFVAGTPKPAGSKRAFVLKSGKHAGRAIITDACKGSKDWKTDVKQEAQRQYSGPLIDVEIRLKLTFHVLRPKSHFRTGSNSGILKDGAPLFPTTKPDVLKLARGVEDALTGIIWIDDALIVSEFLYKRYDDRPGVTIEISEETT